MSKRFEKYRRLPVFKKAQEILELAEVIAETLKEDDKAAKAAALCVAPS